MNTTAKLDRWHHTRPGLLIMGIIELGLSYGFASLSITSGNLWWYLVTIILFVGGIHNLLKLIGNFFHGKRS